MSISSAAGFVQLTAQAPLHWPGDEAVFDLTLRNDGDEPWRGRYCVELLGNEHPLVMIGQDNFVLQAGEPLTQELRYQLPDDLPHGIYGLALVVPGEVSVIGNLPIGDTNEDLTGSWPEPSCW